MCIMYNTYILCVKLNMKQLNKPIIIDFFFIESFIVGLYGFTEKNLLTFKK